MSRELVFLLERRRQKNGVRKMEFARFALKLEGGAYYM
jgi:hypothetical protein